MGLASLLSSTNATVHDAVIRSCAYAVGLAQDLWKNGNQWPASLPFGPKAATKTSGSETDEDGNPRQSIEELQDSAGSSSFSYRIGKAEKAPWIADRAQVLEKLWGEGHILPSDGDYLDNLTSLLGLNHEMSVLDLGAGLGGLARHLAETYKTYVTGFEQDPSLAARGMVMSIAAGQGKHANISTYDPVTFTATRKYDCIIARDVFYKVVAKEKFFKAINTSLKSGGGQLIFTDYILEMSAQKKNAVMQWLTRERGASPYTLIDMVKTWKQMGYDVRVMEDQTDLYREMIIHGLGKFVKFLSTQRLETATKLTIMQEVELWATRVMAFDEGLKYYRFYAIKR